MENDEQVESQDLETETTDEATDTTADTSEQAEETLTPEQVKELKAKAAKADELEKTNKQLFERAKKAEGKPKTDDALSTTDALALVRADVHEDDQDSVLKWAKLNGTTVAEALKDKDLKVVLDAHAEERRTAAATNTTGGARGGSKVSGSDILAKAERTGEVPDTVEGMAALAKARQDRLRTKKD